MRPLYNNFEVNRAAAWSPAWSIYLATTCRNNCRSPARIVDVHHAPLALPGKDPPKTCKKKKKKEQNVEAEAPAAEGGIEATSAATGAPHHHRAKRKKLWLVFGVSQDVALLGGDDVCSESGQNAGFYCFRDDGNQYIGNPVLGARDKISSGFALSATRILAGLDYALGSAAIGARLGYTLRGTSPKPDGGSSMPFLAAARVEYWIAPHAYSTKGFAVYLLGEAGLAEADATHRVALAEDTTKPSQQVNPASQELDAWKRMGRGFAGLGLGGFVPVGKSGGVVIELEGKLMFPASGFVLGPTLAYAAGF